MALLKYGNQQGFIYFFQNEDFPNLYLVFEWDESSEWYDRFTRKGKYSPEFLTDDDRARGIDFGWPKLNVKKPIRFEVDDTQNMRWQFMNYLKEHYFTEHIEDKENNLQYWGWYKFEGSLELDKWLNEFYNLQRQQELQKTNKAALQTSLF